MLNQKTVGGFQDNYKTCVIYYGSVVMYYQKLVFVDFCEYAKTGTNCIRGFELFSRSDNRLSVATAEFGMLENFKQLVIPLLSDKIQEIMLPSVSSACLAYFQHQSI